MSEARWTAVDRYITDRLVAPDPTLDAVLAASDAAGLPPINVAPNQGKLLMLLAQIQGPNQAQPAAAPAQGCDTSVIATRSPAPSIATALGHA